MLTDYSYGGVDYKVLTQTASELIAINSSSNADCCNRFMVTSSDGVKTFCHVPNGDRSYNFVARRAALSCFTNESSDFESKELREYDPKPFSGSPFAIPPISPKIVSGTDPGSTYTIIVQTLHGYVARRNDSGMTAPRIRVVKHDPGNSWPPDAYALNESGVMWQTHKPSHLGCDGHTVSRTAILVARGVNVLLKLGKKL